MADVFVSYKKEDRPVAERLVKALRAAGKSVWWDDALNPNQAWDATIEAEIAASRHVIVLWTPRSVQSDWVRSEAHYAQDHGKMVPVMVEPCTLPIAFMLRQAVDLSSGRFDERDPNWARLMGWLEGDPSVVAEDRAAAKAAVPIKTLTGMRWLGPAARRPAVAYGAIAAALVVVAALSFLLLRGQFGAPPQPAVVIDPLTTASAKGLPDGFAKAVSNEMFAGFSSSSRISPVVGDGKRRLDAYQLTGDVVTSGDKVQVFAKLYAPHIDAPVLTTKLEEAASNKALPLEFGLGLARLTRCVATASDSNGSKLTTLPREALGPWASFCQQTTAGEGSPQSTAAALRSVVAAAPNFANGWSNLAEALYVSAIGHAGDKAALLKEADQAAERALAIDPKTAKALVVKSWGAIGLAGPPDGSSNAGRLHNFAEWEALALKSIRVRPSDCGCEVPQYAGMLTIFGRQSAAVQLMEQAVATDPTELGHALVLSDLLVLNGAGEQSEKHLGELAEKWPDSKAIPRRRMIHALWRRDWAAAKPLVVIAATPDDKKLLPPLLDALARGDTAGARAAGAPFIGVNSNLNTASEESINALAAAGYTDEVVDAIELAVNKGNLSNIQVVFSPLFAAIRKTSKFATLVEKFGFMDYWKMPGHRPDFCNEPDPAALCAGLSKT